MGRDGYTSGKFQMIWPAGQVGSVDSKVARKLSQAFALLPFWVSLIFHAKKCQTVSLSVELVFSLGCIWFQLGFCGLDLLLV